MMYDLNVWHQSSGKPSRADVSTTCTLARGWTVSKIVARMVETLGPPRAGWLAQPRLSDRARAGLRLFEERVGEYVDLAGEMGTALPGPGRSPFVPPRTASAREAASAARRLRRLLDLGGGALGDPFQVLGEHVLIWRLPLGTDLAEAPSGFFYNHPRAGFCTVVNSGHLDIVRHAALHYEQPPSDDPRSEGVGIGRQPAHSGTYGAPDNDEDGRADLA
jgi:hypothetical protein